MQVSVDNVSIEKRQEFIDNETKLGRLYYDHYFICADPFITIFKNKQEKCYKLKKEVFDTCEKIITMFPPEKYDTKSYIDRLRGTMFIENIEKR
jgi:hypothetical protein